LARFTTPALAAGSLARLTQPVLTLDDGLLRPWQPADVDAVVAAYSDPAIQLWHDRSTTTAQAREWIAGWSGRWAAETGAGWAIADASGVLGQISLRRLDFHDAVGEVSYWVLPAARGRRLAPRALRALSAWAFGELGLHRIELEHSTRNAASCRVAQRAGYVAEGTRRSAVQHADGWHDMHQHALLASDPG
jgi:RimJ/RimL family protein N-acetyltransferase